MDDDGKSKATRRIVSAVCALVGVPGFVYCGLTHLCMDGHGAHPPYPAWEYVSDVLWAAMFVSGSVFAWRSNMRNRQSFCALLMFLPVSRVLFRGFFAIPIELPAMIFTTALAIRGLRDPDRPLDPPVP